MVRAGRSSSQGVEVNPHLLVSAEHPDRRVETPFRHHHLFLADATPVPSEKYLHNVKSFIFFER